MKSALPALTQYLEHDSADVREAAAELRAGESTPVRLIFGTEDREVLGRSALGQRKKSQQVS